MRVSHVKVGKRIRKKLGRKYVDAYMNTFDARAKQFGVFIVNCIVETKKQKNKMGCFGFWCVSV